MLANHRYAADAPEGRALRMAFKCALAMVSFVAFVLFCGTLAQRDRTPNEDSVARARASAYNQNKPGGSIFSPPKPRSVMARVPNTNAPGRPALTNN